MEASDELSAALQGWETVTMVVQSHSAALGNT
jgi:hypothetical protein